MAAISFFWYTNMAAVTSDENDLLVLLSKLKYFAYGYAVWLCRMAMPYGYAVWLCRMAMPYGYAVWLCRMAMPYGYAVWLCRMAMYCITESFACGTKSLM